MNQHEIKINKDYRKVLIFLLIEAIIQIKEIDFPAKIVMITPSVCYYYVYSSPHDLTEITT